MLELSELQAMLEIDSMSADSALREYKDSKAYYHGHQIDPATLGIIQARGQVPVYENIFKMICDKILGYKIQSSTEIKVYGRQEEDKALANLLCDLLKVFNQQNNYEKEIYKRDFDLLMGLSVVELWIEQDTHNDKHITLKHIPTDCFMIDAYSIDKNAIDATRFHKKQNINYYEARAIIGEEKEIYVSKEDIADKRAFIIESWIKEPHEKLGFSWNRYLWHSNGGIYKYEVAPFKNGAHPFVIAKYNIDEKNNWYGLFRDIKPIQDEINFSEIKTGNLLGSVKALYESDAVDDVDSFADNIGKGNALIQVRSGALKEGKIEFIQHQADISALTQRADIKRTLAKVISGLNEEALGQAVNRQSGVAIAQRRELGLLGLQYYVKSADDMDRLLYEKVLDFIQHYYTKEQVFRITDKKTGERYFKINTDENNAIKIGCFDLVYKTQLKTQGREERFAHWAEILKTIGSVRGDILPQLLPLMLKDTDSPIIEDIEEVLANAEAQAQEAQQAQAPMQQKMQELEMAKMQSQIAKLNAEVAKLTSQAEMLAKSTELIQEQSADSNTSADGLERSDSNRTSSAQSQNTQKEQNRATQNQEPSTSAQEAKRAEPKTSNNNGLPGKEKTGIEIPNIVRQKMQISKNDMR